MLELTEGHPFPEPAELAPAALSLALALRGTGGTKAPKLNFRKGQYASAQAEGAWRDRLGALGVMAAVLLVLFSVSTFAKLHSLEVRETKLDDALCEATKKILGTCETDFRVALGRLKGKGSPAASIPQVSAVDLLNDVSNLFPPKDDAKPDDVVLTDLDIVDTMVTMRGDAKSYESVDNLVASLQKDKCFSEIKKGNLQKGKNDRIEFKLDALYSCGAAKKAGS
jgi:general secretion pathway protein L